MQEEVGLRAVTDGEFRRTSWHMDFIYALDGITTADEKMKVALPQRRGRHRVHVAPALHVDEQGRRRRRRSSATPSRSCRSARRRAVPKLTIPSPSMVHYRGGRAAIDESVYPDLERVLERPDRRLPRGGAPPRRARLHLPPARRHEPRVPQRPGAAPLHGVDRRRPRAPARRVHPRTSTRRSQGRPEGMSVTTHMCRGQLPLVVGGRGRLRLRRRGAVPRARRRRLLPGVRRRALRRVRAAALRARRASRSCSAS